MSSSPFTYPEQYRPWSEFAAELGFEDFLSAEDGFKTCLRAQRAWSNQRECGVYFWIAEDGETYVGETLNARSRLLEHLRNNPDLSYAAFRAVPPESRKAVEADLIHRANLRFPTRNIKRAISSETHVPFDDFVSAEDRKKHLSGCDIGDAGDWRDLPVLTQKHARKFQRFERRPDSSKALMTLSDYVWSVIPRPRCTEARFWSVSLFVGPHLLRVNAGQQEVFTLTEADGNLYARPLAMVPFEGAEGPIYQTRSFDHWTPAEELLDWLTGQRLVAARELCVRLMRHTTALNSGSHCPQIVRAAAQVAETG